MNGIHEVTGSIPVWSTTSPRPYRTAAVGHGQFLKADVCPCAPGLLVGLGAGRAREPPGQALRRRIRRGPVERHERRRPAGRARDLGAPAVAPDRLHFDGVMTPVDRFVESDDVHEFLFTRR